MDEGGADVDVLAVTPLVTVLMLGSPAPVTVAVMVTQATRPVQDHAQENVESYRTARHYHHGGAVYLEIIVMYSFDCEIHQYSSDVPARFIVNLFMS